MKYNGVYLGSSTLWGFILGVMCARGQFIVAASLFALWFVASIVLIVTGRH